MIDAEEVLRPLRAPPLREAAAGTHGEHTVPPFMRAIAEGHAVIVAAPAASIEDASPARTRVDRNRPSTLAARVPLTYARGMAARRKKADEGAPRLRGDERRRAPATKEDVRAIGVMVERLESSVRGLAEGMTSLRSELKSDIVELERHLSERISVLEEVVRKNSEDIRKNSEDIRLLRIEVGELRLRFDAHDGRVRDLERRVEILEQRLLATPG